MWCRKLEHLRSCGSSYVDSHYTRANGDVAKPAFPQSKLDTLSTVSYLSTTWGGGTYSNNHGAVEVMTIVKAIFPKISTSLSF